VAARSDTGRADPIDRIHLDRLATRFGSHFLIELIDLFIAQGRDRMAMAERGVATGESAPIVTAAHALKSSAGNLGAGPLGYIAGEIERRGNGGASVESLAPLVGTLRDSFAAACDALEAHRALVVRRTPNE
jgi:HPt (histidine-containing phosphotransfer) domain-containing protein